ncbi:glycoside hydrolase family 1 protein [Jatrophihabitans fulvus]
MRSFPPGFRWGSATASYQIEGAAQEDGRGPSIWDAFSHTPGRVTNGDTGDVACDHYHRVAEDVALMAELGLPAYRFSVAWPRIVPTGAGAVNQAGLDFYSRLVDELLAQGVAPLVTLYHWDLPLALHEQGGWTNRDTSQRFAEYAGIVGRALGDRVGQFTTLNEPWCSAYLGYSAGVHAPGHTDHAESLTAVHHLNLAHGLGATALRSVLPASGEVSVTLNLAQVEPYGEGDDDAVRHVDGLSNRVFLDPMLRGEYPQDVLDDVRHITDFGFVRDGDLAAINVPIDFLGVNYYTPTVVTANAGPAAQAVRPAADPGAGDAPSPYPGSDLALAMPQPGPHTAMHWRIEPAAFTRLLLRVARDHPEVPIVVTENGAAFDDVVEADGSVHDADRVDYLRGHLGAVLDALDGGADVRGYFAWSLMDNFEWAHGYGKRFGLVRVERPGGSDEADQRRTVKDSGRFYAAVASANALD